MPKRRPDHQPRRTCAVCRTDVHVVDGELPNPKLPLIPGHEIVGEVVAGGSASFANGRRVVALLDVEVCAEKGDHGVARRHLAIRDRAGVLDAPALAAGLLHDLPHEPRLADTGLPDDRHELAVAGDRAAQNVT